MRPMDAFKLLRPHQWVKNGFIAAPLLFTPAAVSAQSVATVLVGVVSFCCLSSAVYIFNDYMDRETDRQHARKRLRPLAAGTVSVPVAFLLMAMLFAGGGALALGLSLKFASIAGIYLGLNLVYSVWLKHVSIIDLMLVAAGFVLRVEAGAALIGVEPSVWIIVMTGLLALFFILAKRRDDLIKRLGDDHRGSLEGYTKPFLDAMMGVILGALLVAYLIYTTDEQAMERLGTDNLVYTTPFVIAGIFRYLQITIVEERSGSPTTIVLTDPFLIVTFLGWLLTFVVLLYG